ncbi:hypothetical protein GDO86_004537 [Hymenochirus boettgeri]|uniref:Small ribosomal subunit protein mS31 n=1 Tax=Hymenochirus boettgeri TaxID=247094 RepID=A0A8T2K6D8_9PIPI|nr:hypothetical protein GDO86_004537 [Hymenochirus boettgeri]
MYRSVLLPICKRGSRALNLLGSEDGAWHGSSRHTYSVQRWFGSCSVLQCKNPKNSSEDTKAGKQETTDQQPKPDERENLLNVIGGMKVEISARRRFQSIKMNRAKEHSAENNENMESASSMFQRAAEESHTENNKPLSLDLMAAVSAVAASVPLNKKQIESELLQQLRKHEQETDVQKKGEKASDFRANSWHSNQIRFDDDGRGYTHDRGVTQELAGTRKQQIITFSSLNSRRGLYTGKRLNIFPVFADHEQPTGTESFPSLWDVELANEIASSAEHPPKNGFEEMIEWTKEGKLWTFPIDNETGLDEEQKVEFHEHIFLDKYLEDFPKHGPIRHFMELVVCGLSKNPYITVKQKQDHIAWFRDYFQQKEDILRECEVYLN